VITLMLYRPHKLSSVTVNSCRGRNPTSSSRARAEVGERHSPRLRAALKDELLPDFPNEVDDKEGRW
jgi:hypothetical protein